MSRTESFPIARPSVRMARGFAACGAMVAFGLAFATSPALAGSDYPPGLFENSPVVGPGSSGATSSSGSSGAAATSRQPSDAPAGPIGADAAPDPYGAASAPPPSDLAPSGPYGDAPGAPPRPIASVPPTAYAPPPYDECANMASRVFASLDEVRRAHARCDHPAYGAAPGGYPPPD